MPNVYNMQEFILPMPIPPENPGLQHVRHGGTQLRSCYVTESDHIFVPRGLSLWGTTPKTKVQIRIQHQPRFVNYVPAEIFTTHLSFDEIRRGLELDSSQRGKTVPEKVIERFLQAAQWRELPWGFLPTINGAETLELEVLGPVTSAVFWGTLGVLIPTSLSLKYSGVAVGRTKTSIGNFGRFHYMGALWGARHVWSTTDPPNYGATIQLEESGDLLTTTSGSASGAPTQEEIETAQCMVRGE